MSNPCNPCAILRFLMAITKCYILQHNILIDSSGHYSLLLFFCYKSFLYSHSIINHFDFQKTFHYG